MKKINSIFVTAFLLVITAQSSVVEAAEVRSISREIVQKINGKQSLKVRVTCAEVSDARVILKLKRSGPWCSADLPSACAKQKLKAAEKVCGTHFQSSVNEYNAKKNASPSEPVTGVAPESILESDVQIAAVAVPLSSQSDSVDAKDETQQDSDLEKRYEEYVESIDF